MPDRNYYETLGIAKGASADDVRRAYRKLARQYHPDVNKAPDAARKFGEIQNAYDVLSDEQKRRLYDQYGEAGLKGGFDSGATGDAGAHYTWTNVGQQGGPFKGFDFDADELGSVFEAIFGGQGRGRQSAGPRARGHKAGRQPRSREPVSEEPAHVSSEISVSFMTAAKGGTEHVRLSGASGQGKTIEVTIPPGLDDATTLRIRRVVGPEGEEQDLLLTVRVGGHPLFRRGEFRETGKGLDLYLDLPLTIAEATLGADVAIPTLEGSVELRIPPGTASGRRLRLRGQGLRTTQGALGDLYAVVKIVPPSGDELTEHERRTLEQVAAKGRAVRPPPDWP